MKTIQAPRASAILYQLLVSQKQKRPWLLPANICPIVPITFMKAGVPFEFVDISAETLGMDLNQAEARLMTKREFGGLLYAHTYGEESTPDDFFARAKMLSPEMLIVDDRCLCVPKFGTDFSADIVLFSTGYAKIVELEFGGYALAKEHPRYQPVQLKFDLIHHKELEKSYKAIIQTQSRFVYRDSDWLQTDAELPDWNTYRLQIENGLKSTLPHRARLNSLYASTLPGEIQLPGEYQTWRFNLRVKNKQKILKAIFEDGLFAGSHYASLAGIMADGNAPVAEALAGEAVNLFNDHHFDDNRAAKLCKVILENMA